LLFLAQLLRSKLVIWTLIVLPGLWPIWPLYVQQDPSALADGLKFILLHLGFVASVLLVTVLTFTPLRVLFPKSPIALALNRHRRLVGVSAFAYGLLHFTVHILYEGGPAVIGPTMKTAVEKPFLLVGLIALSILLILAVTSFHAAIRWLGGKRWKNIHRLAYIALGLVAYHQVDAKKVFPMEVVWIFGPLLLLEIARIIKQRTKTRPPAAAEPVVQPAR
jgi:sulfoxide reductase heme-binding subunit YedZ